jgi:hypothetical protein
MELQLNPDEQQLLLELLQKTMRELSHEISRTDCHDFKRMLLGKQQLLENLAGRLNVLAAA